MAVPRVLIVAGEKRVGIARFPQTLHEAGLRVDVIDAGNGPIGLSRFIHEYIPCTPANLVQTLQVHLRNQAEPYTWVILGDEPALKILLPHCRQPWLREHFPVPVDGELPEMVTSKTLFTNAFQARSTWMPRSIVCRNAEEVHAAARELGFPFMIKCDEGTAGLGVRKVDDSAGVTQALSDIPHGPWIAQQFIDGRVGSTACLFDRGRPVAWYASFKAIVFPKPFGASCVRELFNHPKMQELVAHVGEMTHFRGIAGVDWMVDRSNRLFLTEMNPRPMPGFHIGVHAGVDFRKAIYEVFIASKFELRTPTAPAGTRIYMWPQYAMHAIYDGSLWSLFRLLPGLAPNDTPWREPRLMLHQARDLVRRFFSLNWMRLKRKTKRILGKLQSAPSAGTGLAPAPADRRP